MVETLTRRVATLICAAAAPGLAFAQASAPARASVAAYVWPVLLIAFLVGLRAIAVAVARRGEHAPRDAQPRRSPWIASGRGSAARARR